MKRYLLAGDVGGTKADLALYAAEPESIILVREERLPSGDFTSFTDLLKSFVGSGLDGPLVAAAFGLPGPIVDGRIVVTNLPWEVVEPDDIAKALECPRVRLMNDLESTAYGALHLPDDALHVLNPGVPRTGNRAVIAAGTGLGQAILFWNGTAFQPAATEGGHASFAPRDENEEGLLRFLRAELGGHVSWERVVCGPGLHNVFRYVDTVRRVKVSAEVRAAIDGGEDAAAVIGRAALEKSCAACVESMDMFVRAYGAQAGNLVLTAMSLGGLYIGGGIVTKILPAMTSGTFMDAFVAKGRYRKMLSEVPVRIILDPRAARIGAAMAARALLDPR